MFRDRDRSQDVAFREKWLKMVETGATVLPPPNRPRRRPPAHPTRTVTDGPPKTNYDANEHMREYQQ